MKLVYLANARLPTKKAHGMQLMHMCAAFVKAGAQVELVTPSRSLEGGPDDPFSYYGIERSFTITRLPISGNPEGKWAAMFFDVRFALKAARYARGVNPDIAYSRNPVLLALLGKRLRSRAVCEAHAGHDGSLSRMALRRIPHIVAITKGVRDFWIARGVRAERIIVEPDGIDLATYDALPSREGAREALGLSKDEKLVVYTGHLYQRKGAEILAEAASLVPDARVALVGGTADNIARFRGRFGFVPNLGIEGYVPPEKARLWQKAADVLILPNSSRDADSSTYTSPLKLFEYMATTNPIVASDVPALREILSDDSAVFVIPDDPVTLAQGIQKALNGREDAARKAQSARADVAQYAWDARARRILGYALNTK